MTARLSNRPAIGAGTPRGRRAVSTVAASLTGLLVAGLLTFGGATAATASTATPDGSTGQPVETGVVQTTGWAAPTTERPTAHSIDVVWTEHPAASADSVTQLVVYPPASDSAEPPVERSAHTIGDSTETVLAALPADRVLGVDGAGRGETGITLTGLDSATEYRFAVRTVTGSGEVTAQSDLSETIATTAEPVEQAIDQPAGDPEPATDQTQQISTPLATTDSPAANPVTVTNAEFRWGINNESTGGAYFGSCNFLSAGPAGDTGSSRVWSESEGFFRAESGNVSVDRPTASGSREPVTWRNKCLNPQGASVSGKTTSAADSYTRAEVSISHGTGTVDAATNTANLSWTGAFTVAYYGGMTYWTASNPVLTVNPDGTGAVVATLSGFAADMDNPEKWGVLSPRSVTIATLTGVTVTADGIIAQPNYLGTATTINGRNSQAAKSSANAAWWGSFPDEFIQFHQETGQDAYWFTTDGGANSTQPRKVALPITVGFSGGEAPVAAPEITTAPRNLTTTDGLLAQFDVTAAGKGLSYRWQRSDTGAEWTDINAATSPSYGFIAGAADSGSRFRVIVTNPAGSVESAAAVLTVGARIPGSVSPGIGSVDKLVAEVAAERITRLDSAALGIPTNLTAAETLRFSLPLPTTAGPTEVWLYPGERYLAQATSTGSLASIAVPLAGYSPGTYYLLFVSTDSNMRSVVRFTVSAAEAGPADITNAVFRWGMNVEVNGGAFFGKCNFLSAGTAGNAGSSRVWGQDSGLYQTASGNVRIEKPDANGNYGMAEWATRCSDRNGKDVSTGSVSSTTESQVVFSGGTGSVDRAHGTAEIRWTGSFTVAFYGGMTYWSASNPILTIAQNGTGTLTATGSGFGADMDDVSKWVELRPRTITLATLSAVQLGELGFSTTPDYLGVAAPAGSSQPALAADNAAYWGSFPTDFVQFQNDTGQSAYWHTSGGARDRAKLTTPLTVCFDAGACSATAGADPAAAAAPTVSAPTAKKPPVLPPAVAPAGALAATVVSAVVPASEVILMQAGAVTDPTTQAAMMLFALLSALGGLVFIAGTGGVLVKLGIIPVG